MLIEFGEKFADVKNILENLGKGAHALGQVYDELSQALPNDYSH